MTTIAARLERNRATYRPLAVERTGEDAAGEVKLSPALQQFADARDVVADIYRMASREGWNPDQAAAVALSRLGLDGAA